jgi:hypothetical protein
MRVALFALALVGKSAQVPRPSALGRILMQMGIPDPVETFEGRFYGVSAAVELNMRTRVAQVRLNGVPLGGRISGTGWLKDPESESGTVVLEPDFEARLARRYVSIYSAHLDREHHTVTVNVKMPILGIMSLVLT